MPTSATLVLHTLFPFHFKSSLVPTRYFLFSPLESLAHNLNEPLLYKNNNEFISLDIIKSDGKINRLELTNEGNVLNHINYDGSKWIRIGRFCTTNVANVGLTTIKPTFPSTVKLGNTQTTKYIIKNGWANVTIIMNLKASPKLGWTTIATGLPKPYEPVVTSSLGETSVNNASVGFRIKLDGTLDMLVGSEITKSDWWNLSFTYPVAES